jgi:hypothetical protein
LLLKLNKFEWWLINKVHMISQLNSVSNGLTNYQPLQC